MNYRLELDPSEKALVQNALINMKFSVDSDPEFDDILSALIYRLQSMRLPSYDYEAR